MKAIFIFSTIFLFSIPSLSAKNNSLNFRINPLGVIFGVPSIAAEINILDNFSIGPRFDYSEKNILYINSMEEHKVDILGVGPELRYYITDSFLEGLYFSAHYLWTELDAAQQNNTLNGSQTGGTLGYSWSFKYINISFGAGAIQINYSENNQLMIDLESSSTTYFLTEFFLGVAF